MRGGAHEKVAVMLKLHDMTHVAQKGQKGLSTCVTALELCIGILDHFSHTMRDATWPHGLNTWVGRAL